MFIGKALTEPVFTLNCIFWLAQFMLWLAITANHFSFTVVADWWLFNTVIFINPQEWTLHCIRYFILHLLLLSEVQYFIIIVLSVKPGIRCILITYFYIVLGMIVFKLFFFLQKFNFINCKFIKPEFQLKLRFYTFI